MRRWRRAGGAALMLAASPAAAQDSDGWRLEGSVRVRGEALTGQFRPGLPDGEQAILTRVLLFGEYARGPLRIGAELQDSRSFGEGRRSSVSTGEVNALEPIQAYAAWQPSEHERLTLGRFTLNLGSRRLVARDDFRNTTNAFTGVRAEFRTPVLGDTTAFWTMTQNRLPDGDEALRRNRAALDRESGASQLFGALTSRPDTLGGRADAYLFRLAERDTGRFATRDRRLWTVGGRYLRAPGPGRWDMELEGAWQGGTTRRSSAAADTEDVRVDAGFVHLQIGHTFDAAWRPRVAIAYDLASGDGPGGGYGRFDTLFGTRTNDFGPSSYHGAFQRANLSSPELRFESRPDERWETLLGVRPLWVDEATDSVGATGVRDPAGRSGRYAGTQVEFRARHWLIPERVRGAIGGAYLAKGRLLNTAPNAPATGDTLFGYVELVASF